MEAVTGLTRKPFNKDCSCALRSPNISRPWAVSIMMTGGSVIIFRMRWLVCQPSISRMRQAVQPVWDMFTPDVGADLIKQIEAEIKK